MNKKLWLESLWDEWLISESESPDYAASGLLMGMKHKNESFTTNRIRAAKRLTDPGKIKLWTLTLYYANQNIPLGISMTTRKTKKPSIKFNCPYEILKLPKNINSSWQWLKGLWGSTGGLYFPRTGYYLTLIIADKNISDITRSIIKSTGLSWREHRNEFTLKNHEDIMTFLHKVGMNSGALEFGSMVMMRSLRNRVNLERNYDSANIARSVNAARRQTELARKIIAEGLLDSLNEWIINDEIINGIDLIFRKEDEIVLVKFSVSGQIINEENMNQFLGAVMEYKIDSPEDLKIGAAFYTSASFSEGAKKTANKFHIKLLNLKEGFYFHEYYM